MSLSLILIVVLVFLGICGIVVLLVFTGAEKGNPTVKQNLRAMVDSQRDVRRESKGQSNSQKENLAFAAAADDEKKKTISTSKMTLEKKLRYGRWVVTPVQFRAIQIVVTLIILLPSMMFMTPFFWSMVLFMSPALTMAALDRSVRIRFELFDEDYPVLLLSYVSMLKTGMSAIQGLENAAKGLDEDALVRAEVELLIERLRLGLTEEQAIGAFGEDIAHPEIELFVQCLILSRRVGGQLSSTLERLAKQVRKRQEFRKKAVAAVGMERSSLYVVAGIMGLLLVYIAWQSPVLIFPAMTHPAGRKAFQAGISMIIIGFYWSRKVTDIKI